MVTVPVTTIPSIMYAIPVTVGIVMTLVVELYVGATGTASVGAPAAKRARTAFGVGSDGSVPTVPYSRSSSSASLAELTRLESIVSRAVGLRALPLTTVSGSTAVVVISQLKLIASGESLMVANAFSDGAAR